MKIDASTLRSIRDRQRSRTCAPSVVPGGKRDREERGSPRRLLRVPPTQPRDRPRDEDRFGGSANLWTITVRPVEVGGHEAQPPRPLFAASPASSHGAHSRAVPAPVRTGCRAGSRGDAACPGDARSGRRRARLSERSSRRRDLGHVPATRPRARRESQQTPDESRCVRAPDQPTTDTPRSRRRGELAPARRPSRGGRRRRGRAIPHRAMERPTVRHREIRGTHRCPRTPPRRAQLHLPRQAHDARSAWSAASEFVATERRR